MRPVSAALLETVRGSHQMAVRCRLVETYQEGTDPDGDELDVVDGEVHLDGLADVRSTVDLTVRGDWPSRGDNAFAPYGSEVYVERGVAFGNGVVEWVGLGYFRIDSIDQSDAPSGAVRITGSDRNATLIDARLLAPVQYLASAAYGSVIEGLVTQVYPDATIDWDDATDVRPLGRQVVAEDDRWGLINELVTSVGKVWYWDHRGRLQIKDLPDDDTPVWSVDAGENGVLVEAQRTLSRQDVYNIVVCFGEGADDLPPVRGSAKDNDPQSPTYYRGRYGPVPMFFSSPLLTETAQCRAAARAILRRRGVGLPYQVDGQAVCNPALEPYDPITVRYVHAGSTEDHVLTTVSIPLGPEGAQQWTTREKAIVIVGEGETGNDEAEEDIS